MKWNASGVGVPDINTAAHDRAHGGLEIEVPNYAAGDTGRACGYAGFVHDQDVFTGPLAAGFEFFRQVPPSAQAMHTGADDQYLIWFVVPWSLCQRLYVFSWC